MNSQMPRPYATPDCRRATHASREIINGEGLKVRQQILWACFPLDRPCKAFASVYFLSCSYEWLFWKQSYAIHTCTVVKLYYCSPQVWFLVHKTKQEKNKCLCLQMGTFARLAKYSFSFSPRCAKCIAAAEARGESNGFACCTHSGNASEKFPVRFRGWRDLQRDSRRQRHDQTWNVTFICFWLNLSISRAAVWTLWQG